VIDRRAEAAAVSGLAANQRLQVARLRGGWVALRGYGTC
jgi:hypothetical protein